MSRLTIREAVRMSVQVEQSTGRAMNEAWVVALPVEVAVAQLNAALADSIVMRRLAARIHSLPVIEVDIDAIHRKVRT